MKKIIISGMLLLSISQIKAQEKSISLDSVQVTANRTKQNITETGKNVQVITSKEIQALPVNNTDELLRILPGIEIQSRGGFGVQSDMTLRGSTYNQVLILVDGVRVNDPLTGHFNGYVPVVLNEIERVEITKGTASSIYGADAVGGVINFITKNEPSKSDLNVVASVKAGSYGYQGSDLAVLGKQKKWRFSVGVKAQKSDGEQYLNPNLATVASAPENKNTWFETSTYVANIGRELGENWKFNLRSSYDQRSFAAQYFYTSSVYDESVENTSVFFNDLKLSGKNGNFTTDVDLAYRVSTDEFIFNPLFAKNDHETRFGLFQLNQAYKRNEKHTFVYGTQIDFRSIESSDRGDHENFHLGVYGQWVGKMTKNLTTTLSLRGDYDDNYDFEVSPQLNLSYIYKKFVFRGGVGRGIRAADYTERYVSNNLPALSPGRNLGNPDLVAETSFSYEVGFDYYVMDGLKFVATGFYRASDNLIDYVPTPGSEITNVPVTLVPNSEYFYAKNLTAINTAGIELEMWFAKRLNENSKLSVNLGYTFLDSQNPDGEISKYVSSHANHLVNGNIAYSISKFDLGVTGLFKDREEAYSEAIGVELKPQYLVMNANLGYRLLDNRMTIKAEVINIGDEQYSDILGAKMPGRWYMLGASLNL
ncbi:MAG: TonB-dependent receptor plug domain-containing protein [Salibacteraceae bacterium]